MGIKDDKAWGYFGLGILIATMGLVFMYIEMYLPEIAHKRMGGLGFMLGHGILAMAIHSAIGVIFLHQRKKNIRRYEFYEKHQGKIFFGINCIAALNSVIGWSILSKRYGVIQTEVIYDYIVIGLMLFLLIIAQFFKKLKPEDEGEKEEENIFAIKSPFLWFLWDRYANGTKPTEDNESKEARMEGDKKKN